MRRMFSENQVKNMSVQAVNEGIEQGQIQVGTKLYLHNVVVDEKELQVLNTSSDTLVGQDIQVIFTDSISIRYSNNDNEFVLAPSSNGFYFISAGAIDNLEFEDTEITSDEVIPL